MVYKDVHKMVHHLPKIEKHFFYVQFNISSVVEFQRCWVLNSKVFGQNQIYSNEKIVHPLTGCQKVSKSDFQSEFFMPRGIRIFLNIFFNEEY